MLDEPADHGVGRSRGGLSTKIHQLCDGQGLPLVVLIGPGHAHDSPMFSALMDQLRVPRRGPGRPRTRPTAVLGDRAYSSRANRAHLRSRGICAVIPEQSTHSAHRQRRGRRGGRPVGLDAQKYTRRNVIERSFNIIKNWRGLATRYDNLAITYRAAALLAAISRGYDIYETRPSQQFRAVRHTTTAHARDPLRGPAPPPRR
jgi:transposase